MKIISIILVLLSSCSLLQEPKRTRKPFPQQRLVVREQYPEKLTNQFCEEKRKGECIKWNVVQYDLNDRAVRKLINDAKIPCNIAGRRWRVCLDQPGFCRRSLKCLKWKDRWWDFNPRKVCVKRKQVEEYIPASDHEYLHKAKTVCYKFR